MPFRDIYPSVEQHPEVDVKYHLLRNHGQMHKQLTRETRCTINLKGMGVNCKHKQDEEGEFRIHLESNSIEDLDYGVEKVHEFLASLIDQQQQQYRGQQSNQERSLSDATARQYTFHTRIYLPTEKYPNINFYGILIGPKGNTVKRICKDTSCKLALRERDENKNVPLHLHITGKKEGDIEFAVDIIRGILDKNGIHEKDVRRTDHSEELSYTENSELNNEMSQYQNPTHRHDDKNYNAERPLGSPRSSQHGSNSPRSRQNRSPQVNGISSLGKRRVKSPVSSKHQYDKDNSTQNELDQPLKKARSQSHTDAKTKTYENDILHSNTSSPRNGKGQSYTNPTKKNLRQHNEDMSPQSYDSPKRYATSPPKKNTEKSLIYHNNDKLSELLEISASKSWNNMSYEQRENCVFNEPKKSGKNLPTVTLSPNDDEFYLQSPNETKSHTFPKLETSNWAGQNGGQANVRPLLGKLLERTAKKVIVDIDPYTHYRSENDINGKTWYTAAYIHPDTKEIYYAESIRSDNRSNQNIFWYESKEEARAAMQNVIQGSIMVDPHLEAPLDFNMQWAEDELIEKNGDGDDDLFENVVVCDPLSKDKLTGKFKRVTDFYVDCIMYKEIHDFEGYPWYTSAYIDEASNILYHAQDINENRCLEGMYFYQSKDDAGLAVQRVYQIAIKMSRNRENRKKKKQLRIE